jgi:hypothetical protein
MEFVPYNKQDFDNGSQQQRLNKKVYEESITKCGLSFIDERTIGVVY